MSYPALLAVGIAPLPANVANLVAGVVIAPGAAFSSRPELAETKSTLVRLLPTSIAGAVVGAALLLTTPPGVFVQLVPFLVVLGSLVLVVQPMLLRVLGRRQRPVLPHLLIGTVSVYGGYFGAGSGVMLLAVILILLEERLPLANAIKNILLGVISVVAAAVFVLTGPVPWVAVFPLAAGLLIGSALGPIILRRLPPGLARWIAAALGFGLAGYLWLRPGL